MWRLTDPQGDEARKVKYDIVRYTRGRVLDIGCGPYKAFPHFIGVDNYDHTRQFGWQMKPDIVADADKLDIIATHSQDAVFSSHVLEHLADHKKALKEWWRVLKPGGYLILYLPHADLYPHVGTEGCNPDHKHDFKNEDLIELMKEIGPWALVEDEIRNTDFGEGSEKNEYSFFQVYQKGGQGHRFPCQHPKPEKTAMVIRYGGFGDMLQASSVLPELKKQGYHITFNTVPRGYDILKHDPHIDDFFIQDPDQVPNTGELGDYFDALARRYDKVVNLCESVEASLLALPGRTPRIWNTKARHRYMNHNYLELTHDIADVPQVYHQKFYPSKDEEEWAFNERTKMGGKIVVLYSLSGSSVHKVWPWMDAVIARLLLTFKDDIRIVLLGDENCKLLEAPWVNQKQVLCRSGVWTIRQTLTFAAKQCDLVFGPETGVLNAVGYEDVAKVCLLSHSTKENLTKHWVNTVSLSPNQRDVPCYPCHELHYTWQDCHQDVDPACDACKEQRCEVHTGTAICQSNISADMAWAAILGVWKKTGILDKSQVKLGLAGVPIREQKFKLVMP